MDSASFAYGNHCLFFLLLIFLFCFGMGGRGGGVEVALIEIVIHFIFIVLMKQNLNCTPFQPFTMCMRAILDINYSQLLL